MKEGTWNVEVLPTDKRIMKNMERSAKDVEKTRIANGGRIFANFRIKLGLAPSEKTDENAEKIMNIVLQDYNMITEALSDNHSRVSKFLNSRKGKGIITDEVEFFLVRSFLNMLEEERALKKAMAKFAERFPIWKECFSKILGFGPAMAAAMIANFDIHKAEKVSNGWSYLGLGVSNDDNRAMGRYENHLVTRVVKKNGEVVIDEKTGKPKTYQSLKYNPYLKSRWLGILPGSILKANTISLNAGGTGSPWARLYYDHKKREEERRNIVRAEMRAKGESEKKIEKTLPDLQIHRRAARYTVKMLYAVDIYPVWRAMEGLEVHPPFNESKFGLYHKPKPEEL